MNRRMILRMIGLALLMEAGLMLLPFVAGLCYRERPLAFLVTAGLAGLTGFCLTRLKVKTNTIYARDGFVAVTLIWVVFSAFGALPFVFSGEIPFYVDAFFETMSGFTTTGASILNNIEGLSHACLFWRSFTHWIGGMGVLVFMMAILPLSGEHSMHIMRAEVPGPVVGKLVPRAGDTAKILYMLYTGLTVAETAFLMFGGMSFFDALLHAFGTAGTGGFSTRNNSIAAFQSDYIEMVISSFLVLFAMNFNLFYFIVKGKIKTALQSEELHWYVAIILLATGAIAAGIYSLYGTLGETLKNAFFNVMTIMSTAGFCTVDYTEWPQYIQVLLVILMFIGGCAGSTGGGLKLSRVILLIKTSGADVKRTISPRCVKRVRMDGKCVPDNVLTTVGTFFFLYLFLLLGCTLVASFDGFDFTTSFTAALSCISNVGPGLSHVGPSYNFADFSTLSKVVMSVTMLAGRLEIYPLLILFMPKK
ncbi:MAG: TrkH family potassium uptake protein [Oscillospiraceae bacterium]|nr:TrkH family potassium uptake protein [Oscillospiraceae bacterium]